MAPPPSWINAFVPAAVGASRRRLRVHSSRSTNALIPQALNESRFGCAVNQRRCRQTARQMRMEAGTGVATAADTSTGLRTLLKGESRRFVFVGGKGGVGKTTTSAAIAIRLAEEGFRTLVLSTDPAHSLGDCLDVDLSSGKISQITERLFALESDTSDAVNELQSTMSKLRQASDAEAATAGTNRGAAADLASKLGLDEFSDVLNTLPPGADEFVALAKVIELAQSDATGFDRIVIDTAPTGHTLRLLAFPDFLDNFLGKTTALRERLNSANFAISSLSSVLGAKSMDAKTLDRATERVEAYRKRVQSLSELFRDPARAEFVVVTIATKLSVMESERLIPKLLEEGVWVRNLVVNQLVTEKVEESFTKHVVESQRHNLERARNSFPQLHITKVYRFDMEVRGVFALRAFSYSAFPQATEEEYWGDLFDPSIAGSAEAKGRFVFVGGKGGVGKTSSAAAMGVKMADSGLRTLIISTDPAHSLADSLDVKLTGEPISIANTDDNLYAMEIDTAQAVAEFKALVEEFVRSGAGFGADMARRLGLDEFSGLLENTPPGVDELVALTKVVGFVRRGDFQRVIIDTAPTGHTLRLLAFPDFLDGFLGKVLRLKRRLDSIISSVRNIFGGGSSNEAKMQSAESRIEQFRQNMLLLKSIIEDAERTEFAVVTIPTDLAMAESERLVAALEKDQVSVKNLIVNQVLPESTTESYVRRRYKEQAMYLEELESFGKELDFDLQLTLVNFFDEDVRRVSGLKKVAAVLFHEQKA